MIASLRLLTEIWLIVNFENQLFCIMIIADQYCLKHVVIRFPSHIFGQKAILRKRKLLILDPNVSYDVIEKYGGFALLCILSPHFVIISRAT